MAVAMAILLLGKSVSAVQATSAPESFLIHVQHSQKQFVHAGMDPAASCFVPESKVEVCCSSSGKAEELGKGGFGVVKFFACMLTLHRFIYASDLGFRSWESVFCQMLQVSESSSGSLSMMLMWIHASRGGWRGYV